MKHALLFGASGFVGSCLLRELLADPGYARVTAVTRKSLETRHPKLENPLADAATLREVLLGTGHYAGPPVNEVFIAIGTTRKKTPDQGEYYRIDHDYPVLAASMGKEMGAASVFLVSAVGADAGSRIFYTRTKGEAERDILALDFAHTHIFRPSFIMGRRPEHRPTERLLVALCGVLNPILGGSLKKYRGIEASDIARAMRSAASQPAEKATIYEWSALQDLLKRAPQ